METTGRERHHRYYTVRHYRQFVNEESLDNESAAYNERDPDDVGGFSIVDPNAFYETEGDTVRYTSSYKSKQDVSEKKKARIYKNPILPDGTVKRGRPRKKPEASEVVDMESTVKYRGKRKKAENEEEGSKRPYKKARMSEVSSEPPRECLVLVPYPFYTFPPRCQTWKTSKAKAYITHSSCNFNS
jgi:hypothetical protein